MKKILLSFTLVAFIAGQAFSWGQTGHRVVGYIAQQHLDAKAQKKLMEILQGNSLAEVSTWMDEIKSDSTYDNTHDWHWVTIPDGTSYAASDKNPHGDVIEKINEIVAALKKGGLPAEKEREYVKFLVHLVGDVHQPLHVGTGNDRGGNSVKVKWFGHYSNLHRVWDSDMIDSKQLSFRELADFCGPVTDSQIKQWQSTSVEEWAKESMSYRPQVYDIPASGRLGYEYMYKNFGTVEHRLLQAGIRLAGLLNAIYG